MKFKSVSIIVPAFNEKLFINKILTSIASANTLGLKKEIIIINDASTDGTEKILSQLKDSINVKLINNKSNMGKGYCIKKGILESSGDVVIIQDADLEYSPQDYPSLLRPITQDYADAVYGSRFMNSNPHRVLYYYHYLANKFITSLSNIFTNLNLSDIETGYKVFRGDLIRTLAPKLLSRRFGFEPEITARLAKLKELRIYEVGISYYGRTYKEGKKIGWIDGIASIFQILRYNLFD